MDKFGKNQEFCYSSTLFWLDIFQKLWVFIGISLGYSFLAENNMPLSIDMRAQVIRVHSGSHYDFITHFIELVIRTLSKGNLPKLEQACKMVQ